MDAGPRDSRDIEVTRAVRERFPDCRLLVDANDTYTVAEMIRYVQAVADCNLYWIEEPFEENRDHLKRLREAMVVQLPCPDRRRRSPQGSAATPTPYGGYTQAFADRLFALAAEKLVDVFVMDLGIVGFTRWRKIMPELSRPAYKPHHTCGCGRLDRTMPPTWPPGWATSTSWRASRQGHRDRLLSLRDEGRSSAGALGPWFRPTGKAGGERTVALSLGTAHCRRLAWPKLEATT